MSVEGGERKIYNVTFKRGWWWWWFKPYSWLEGAFRVCSSVGTLTYAEEAGSAKPPVRIKQKAHIQHLGQLLMANILNCRDLQPIQPLLRLMSLTFLKELTGLAYFLAFGFCEVWGREVLQRTESEDGPFQQGGS